MIELKAANLAIRFLLELCALAALGYWGFNAHTNTLMKFILGIGAPLLAAIVWGLFVSPKAAITVHPLLRLAIEALVFGSAILGLVSAGRPGLAWTFGLVLLVNEVLRFYWKQ
jgi:hypothetical protein